MPKINNCMQLCEEWAGRTADNEDHANALVMRRVYKYTDCGCCFDSDSEGVRVSGYAEGSDAELPGYFLKWGFTMEDFEEVLTYADNDGITEWEECNGELA